MSRAGWVAAVAALFGAVGSMLAWQSDASVAVGEQAAAMVDGAMVFRVKGCVFCHSGPDTTAQLGSQFPSLADVSAWAGDRRPGLTAEQYLVESVREPWAFQSPVFVTSDGPTAVMPDLGLSETEVAAVVGYLLAG